MSDRVFAATRRDEGAHARARRVREPGPRPARRRRRRTCDFSPQRCPTPSPILVAGGARRRRSTSFTRTPAPTRGLLDAARARGRAVVIAAMGRGNVPPGDGRRNRAVDRRRQAGDHHVARAARTRRLHVRLSGRGTAACRVGAIFAGPLRPQQARIDVMLALGAGMVRRRNAGPTRRSVDACRSTAARLPPLEAPPVVLPRGANLIGESEAVRPAFLLGAPAAVPHELVDVASRRRCASSTVPTKSEQPDRPRSDDRARWADATRLTSMCASRRLTLTDGAKPSTRMSISLLAGAVTADGGLEAFRGSRLRENLLQLRQAGPSGWKRGWLRTALRNIARRTAQVVVAKPSSLMHTSTSILDASHASSPRALDTMNRLHPPPPSSRSPTAWREAGFEAWCVGGAIRDALLGHPHLDWDLATSATPTQVRELFGARRTIPVGVEFGTVGVLDRNGVMHEVTTFRRDVRDRWPARRGGIRRVARGRSRAARFHDQRDRLLASAAREFAIRSAGEQDLARRIVRAVGDAGRADARRSATRAAGNPIRGALRIRDRRGDATGDRRERAVSRPAFARASEAGARQDDGAGAAPEHARLTLWQATGAFKTLVPALHAAP